MAYNLSSSLVFAIDESEVPRVSLAVAQSALQDVPIDNCALIVPGELHGGKPFDCDIPAEF